MSLTHSNSLPKEWIARIFAALTANYGSRFVNNFKVGQALPDGRDVGIADAQAVWAAKLGCYLEHPDAIKAALDNLPTQPPSLPEFYALCVQHRSVQKYTALPKPVVSQEQGKANISKLISMIKGSKLCGK